MSRIFSLTLAVALAACGPKQETETPSPAPDAERAETTVADAFGVNGRTVEALAFWSHPTVAFEGRLIAAGPDGVFAYKIEDGAEAARFEGLVARDLAIAYFGEGAEALGVLAVVTQGGFQFFRIDNATGDLSTIPAMIATRAANGVCFSGSPARGEMALHRATDDGLATSSLTIASVGITASTDRRTAVEGGLVDCAVDDTTGAVFGIDRRGWLWRIAPEGLPAEKLAETGVAGARDIAIVIKPDKSRIALLDGESADIHLFDLEDGHAAGVFAIASNFDIPGPEKAVAMAIGYGNYGGVYRDGAVAISASGDDAPPIRIAPWNGVAAALALAEAESVDPRAAQRQASEEDDPLAIGVTAP